MIHRPLSVVIIFVLLVLFIIVMIGLWQSQVISLPAAVVRGLGRVSGVMAANVTPTVQLPVVWHGQEHSLSCEAAALQMVLNFHGVPVSESQLISKLPFDSTPRRNDVWGDPTKGFVGNIDGVMMSNGYGVHWQPIAAIAAHWKKSEVVRLAEPTQVVKHLQAGRPIIMWGYYGRGIRRAWRTPAGTVVNAVNGEHTRVITGFYGPAAAPEGFFLLDPIFGPLTWSTSKLMTNWQAFDYQGVVVYPRAS